jgi:hypothetical protein
MIVEGPPTQAEPEGSLLLGARTPAPNEWRPHERHGHTLLGTRALEEAWPELRPPDFRFGEQYAQQQEHMRALEDAVQMQALAVGQRYQDTRFHDLLRPMEPLGIADTIHAAANLQHGPLAIGYGSDSSRGSRRSRRSVDRYNISTPGWTSSEGDSESGETPPLESSRRPRCSWRCKRSA